MMGYVNMIGMTTRVIRWDNINIISLDGYLMPFKTGKRSSALIILMLMIMITSLPIPKLSNEVMKDHIMRSSLDLFKWQTESRMERDGRVDHRFILKRDWKIGEWKWEERMTWLSWGAWRWWRKRRMIINNLQDERREDSWLNHDHQHHPHHMNLDESNCSSLIITIIISLF